MSKARIKSREAVVAYIRGLLQERGGLKRISDYLKKEEPELWRSLTVGTHEDIGQMLKQGMAMYPDAIEFIGSLLMKARIQGYLTSMSCEQFEWMGDHHLRFIDGASTVDEDTAAKYDKWIRGQLDAKYYENLEFDPDKIEDRDKATAFENFKKLQSEKKDVKDKKEKSMQKAAALRAIEQKAGVQDKSDLSPGVIARSTTKRKLTDGLDASGK